MATYERSGLRSFIPLGFVVIDFLPKKWCPNLRTQSCTGVIRTVPAQKQPKTCCDAVYTWMGDTHAAVKHKSPRTDFRDFHDNRHGRFPSTIRSNFDDSLQSNKTTHKRAVLICDHLQITETVRTDIEYKTRYTESVIMQPY